MNHKQKLGYMALGAGIMALGIIIGQVITPNIEAQSDGVFDTIMCRQLFVSRQLFVKNISDDDMSGVYLNPTGVRITRGDDTAIDLQSTEDNQGNPTNNVVIYNPKTGKRSISIGPTSSRDKEIAGMFIWDWRDANSISVAMLSTDETNGVTVVNPQTGKNAVDMKSDEFRNYLTVYDYKAMQREAFSFSSPSSDLANMAMYYDRKTGETRVRNLED